MAGERTNAQQTEAASRGTSGQNPNGENEDQREDGDELDEDQQQGSEQDEVLADDDQGSVDDQGGGNDQDDQPQSRGDRQFGELRRLAREANERAQRAEQLVSDMRQQQQQPRQQQETPQQREERLALMTPDERVAFMLNESRQETANLVRSLQFQQFEQNDKLAFDTKAAGNPVYKRHQAEVETRLVEVRRTGGNIAREELLKWIIGDKALAASGSGRKKAQRDGERRLNGERTNAPNGRGDQGGRRERAEPTLEQRLENVTF